MDAKWLVLWVAALGCDVEGERVEPVAPAGGKADEVGGDKEAWAFDGTALVVVSDTDQVATAYADGKLGNRDGLRDALTVIDLPWNGDAEPELATVDAPNSVVAWPQVVAVDPNGSFAYVVETRGAPDPSVRKVDDVYTDLPDGNLLTTIDLRTDPPSIYDARPIGRNPNAVSVAPDGRRLAVSVEDDTHQLAVVDLDDASIREFEVADADGNPARVTSVQWHPGGDALALTIDDREVLFVGDDGSPLGGALEVGQYLSSGQFVADGRYYLITDLKWGDEPWTYLFNDRGTLTSIRFDEDGDHEIVDVEKVGLSPEGFAVDPQEEFVVTVNMRRTYLPSPVVWKGQKHSSLTLLHFDAEDGELDEIDEWKFDGQLPERAAFDTDGDALAVLVYHDREKNPRSGHVDLWALDRDEAELIETGISVEVPRGPHSVELVP